ncbi:hypothetical protein CBR_g42087 [Chara braunii]|uniref:HAT C-terminal dimerisation domain-containing protein n=1 Tax=Chara braunii TaxID=69332 RepID=A0A388LWV5_CHABU|nr:hypothetical protein CBR_g42087 [Chara braunii]|eukprot:GBG86804.1 hypothetical protein CBR_g42087 [Chara braunii]
MQQQSKVTASSHSQGTAVFVKELKKHPEERGFRSQSCEVKLSMALAKQIYQSLARQFTDEGPHGKDPSKGSRHWLCNYCETRFVGNKSVLKKHFMKKCSIDLVTWALTAEERVMRVEGIRLGKHQASQLLGATGGSSGPTTGPSSGSFVPPSSPRERPSDGEMPSPAGSGTCFPPAPGSGGRSVRQTLIEEADSIITQNEQTSRKMDRFLICTNQPFSLVENYYFLEFVDAVKKCHPSWWPCKRDEMRTKRLDGQFRVCAKAGKMVEAKYPGIFCVGCTAHALDLALEDMYKCMDWMKAVVDKGNQVGKFFTNVDKVRAMYNRIANAQLKRPAVTRFATNFEMLQSLKTGRNPLELCVCNAAWVEKLVRGEQVAAFNAVTHIIMDTNEFWKDVDKAMAVMEPVVKLLRLVDGPGATMSKVYFGMDAVVAKIRTLECLSEAEKADVEKILTDRWAFMTLELHCAAAFLDPEYRTHTLRDTEIREGFNIWLYSWAPPELLQSDIIRQVDTWLQGLATLGTQNARDQASTKTPALWWEAFGGSLDLLQPQAIKLLGQASSSAACERNWSLHQLIYGQRRTKLMPERLSKLVYNNWNIQLATRRERGDREDIHIPWKDDQLARVEVDEWYDEWAAQVREGTAGDAAATEVCVDESDDAPLERTWLHNKDEDNFADDEDDIVALGALERAWHANTKPGKQRVRELRRKSGVEEPDPAFVYTLEGHASENNEEEEEMSQHGSGEPDGSGVPDGDELEEDPSQAESHGEEQSGEEDEQPLAKEYLECSM